jgi:hypothetical protein
MISIGGIQDHGTTDTWATWKDPWPNGLGIFDMTALNWTDTYDAKADPYERGGLVDDFYTTNPRFPATWGDPELLSIFGANVSSNASLTSGPGSATNTSGTSSATNSGSSDSSHSSNLGDMIGGAVGGVAALAILIGIIFWLIQRRKHSRQTSSVGPEFPATEIDSEEPKEMWANGGAQYNEIETNANRHEVADRSDPRPYELPGASAGEAGLQ